MDAAAKQQIVERVKQATNILVTVSNNPSVDQLAACIGLTLLLNKMEKHGTAVFSGKVPSTIEFLQPEKTIEANTDSLQDFIISLDKSKADKLRYKVEDQVVRIFITPYRTSLSEKDLIFSQGDVNVEVVMALGVHDRNELDAAITAHGRILHDATVISINAGAGNPPKIGQINWQDPTASSLSEMLVSISEAFGSGLIDNQMATAFLTGIVAETSRFSNNRTSPKVMTIAAQLMAAGANQQLIVSKLESPVKSPPKPLPVSRTTMKPVESDKDGALNVSHDRSKPDGAEVEVVPSEIHIDKQGNLITSDELHSSDIPPLPPPTLPPMPPPVAPPPMPPLPPPMPPEPPQAPPQPEITPPPQAAPPSLLSPAQELTPEPPLAPLPPPPPIELGMPTDIVRPQPEPHAVIPPHNMIDPMGGKPAINPPFSADMESEWIDPYNTVAMDPLASRQTGTNPMIGQAAAVAPPGQAPPPTAPAGGIDSARDAVQSALAAAPFDPAFAPPVASLGAQTVSSDINNPQPIDGTPSLSLPSNTNGAIGTIPPSPPMNDMNPAAPPNLPPPLPLASNPGAMLPNAPAYQPPITTS